MKNEEQRRQQLVSWIKNNHWNPLLNWFNQNETRQEDWTLLFEQASKYELQEKWPSYLNFFLEHHEHKVSKEISFLTHSQVRAKAWTLLNTAMPAFFVQAAPLLTQQQREAFRSRAVGWFSAWAPNIQESQSLNMRDAISTIFRTLISVDGRAEWGLFEGLVKKEYFPRLVQHTLGKDVQWVNMLSELYLSQGYSQASWRAILLKGDSLAHLLADKTPLSLARAFLDCAVEEQSNSGKKEKEAIAMIFRRYPHFRLWAEKDAGDDAQTCRAILGLPESVPQCVAAKTIEIARSLGLPLANFSALLDSATTHEEDEMHIDTSMFEEMHIGLSNND